MVRIKELNEKNHQIQDKFDRLATRYAQQYEDKSLLGFEKVRRMCLLDAEIAHLKNRTIMDAGCGNGIVMRWLRNKNNRNQLIGLDISMNMLKEARLNNDVYLPLVQSLVERVPFDNCTFDLVFSLGVLGYINDIEQFFETMSKVIKPNGSFIFTYPNRASVSRKLRDKLSSVKNRSRNMLSAQPIDNHTIDKLIIKYSFNLKMRKFITYGSGLVSFPWSIYISVKFENIFSRGLIGKYLGWTSFCILQKSNFDLFNHERN